TYEHADTDKLAATADALAANDDLRSAFVRRDRAALLREAEPIFEQLTTRSDITHWYFITPDRTCFLRVHAPDQHGDVVERLTLTLAQRSGEVASGKELGRTAFALRVVRPWRDTDGTLLGYLELAEDVDHFLRRMKDESGDELALAVKKKHLDERHWREVNAPARDTWNDRPDMVVVDTTSFTDGLVDYQGDLEHVPAQGLLLDERIRAGRAYVRGVFPVRDAGGRNVGALFVLHDFTEIHEAVTATQRRGLFVVLGLGIVLSVLLGVALNHLVFRRLARIRSDLEVIAARVNEPQAHPSSLPGVDELTQLENLVASCVVGAAAPPGADAASRNRGAAHV
ncbi:MAG: cache domain-containing protein, partial [Myxococcales bacterium]